MKKNYMVLPVGLALFTLLFGPGNIIYPLKLGAAAGGSLWYALCGFIITAIAMPMVGFVASLLCHGDYTEMLSYFGRIPGMLITFTCMLLIGPFCILPRCIALSYESLKLYLGGLPFGWFSVIAATLVFAATMRKNLIMPLFGRFFGPIKLCLITGLIIVGAMTLPVSNPCAGPALASFKQGLFDGYSTMDLLGTLFCSGLLAFQLGATNAAMTREKRWYRAKKAASVAVVGGGVLSLVYAGFFYVSGIHASVLQGVEPADMFSVLAQFLLGPVGGVLAGLLITLTCLTTVMALASIFADYARTKLFAGRCSYPVALSLTLLVAGLMSNVGFATIMRSVEPLIVVFYPLLIVLALFIIGYKLFWQSDMQVTPARSLEKEVVDNQIVHQSENSTTVLKR